MSRTYDGQKRPIAGHDPTQQIQFWIDDIVKSWAENLLKLIQTGVDAAIEFAKEAVKEVIDIVVGFVTNPAESLSKLAEWASKILPLDIFAPLIGIANLDPFKFLAWFKGILSIFDRVPIGNLTDEQPELLLNPKFDGLLSIEENDVWNWDELVGRTTPGSAHIEANGDRRPPLYSNPINVAKGQKLRPIVYCIWDELVATGSPIVLSIAEYSGTSLINVRKIDEITSPGASASTWQGLSGTYEVPANIDNIRLHLRVLETATAGDIFFDDASLKREGKIAEGWIDGLTERFAALFGPFGGTVTGLINAIRNLAKIFNVFNILDLANIDPDNFNPLEIVKGWIQTVLNPLGMIRDLYANSMVQGIIDAMLSVLKKVPIVGGSLAEFFEKFLGLNDTAELAVTESNPPIVQHTGRIDALTAIVTSGVEGITDRFDGRAALGTDWTTVTGTEEPELVVVSPSQSYAWGNENRAASYFNLRELGTNEWHVQAVLAGLEQSDRSGISRLWVGHPSMNNFICIRSQWKTGFSSDAEFCIATGTSVGASTPRSDIIDIKKDDLETGIHVMGLRKRYDSVTTTYTYTLYHNNDILTSWEDAGGILVSAAGNRSVGFMLNAEGFASEKGLGWDDINAYDLTS